MTSHTVMNDHVSMADAARPTVRRIRLGRELRRLRENKGWTLATAAHQLRRNFSSIGKVERGEQGLAHDELIHMLDTYGLPESDLRQALIALRRDAHKRGWWLDYRGRVEPTLLDYISLENDARAIYTFETLHFPGLFQTEAYARVTISSGVSDPPPERADDRVALRMARQRLLTTGDPPQLNAVVDEVVLRRPYGGPKVMRAQLMHLYELSQLGSVALQVLPSTIDAHPGRDGAFTLLDVGELQIVLIECITRSWYLESDEDIRLHRLTFDRLSRAALSEGDSRALIQRVMSET